jgi:asparagine synthase (glutamine-hydrolysing)
MCGITGVYGNSLATTLTERMLDTLAHRGPDGRGIWSDGDGSLALGHRRLSIIDLTDRAAQPMQSADGRFVLVYNGEIYNYQELRLLLQNDHKMHFRSDSDTEVLLNGFAVWREKVLEHVNGMFAFSIFDRHERKLYLARDRLGVKPLYWARVGRAILFSSEMRSLLSCSAISKELSEAALREFLNFGYVASPNTIVSAIHKLPPATVMTVDVHLDTETRAYWSAEKFYRGPVTPRRTEDVLEELQFLLSDAFAKRMIADVPVGIYLSGGVDSSLVAALLVRRGLSPKAFTLAIRESGHDESQRAAATARFLGIEHTVEELSIEDLKNQIGDLATTFDEPLADTSALPTLAISKAASRHVKVVLSADGGDELFGGYRRYSWAASLERALRIAPRAALHGAARFARERLTAIAATGQTNPRMWRAVRNVEKLEDVLSHRDSLSRYLPWNAITSDGAMRALFPAYMPGATDLGDAVSTDRSFLDSCMLADIARYLPDDLLMKVDRATMAASMEGRDPFLDHRIVEFCGRLPMHQKIKGGSGKYLLKELLRRHGLHEPARAPKQGFSMPIADWLTHDWHSLLEEHISAKSLAGLPGLRIDAALVLRDRFCRGDRSLAGLMYALLCLSMWRAQWRA